VNFHRLLDVICHKLSASQLAVPQKQGPPAKWNLIRDPTTEYEIRSEQLTSIYFFTALHFELIFIEENGDRTPT
jgi:hypothetical protein